PDFFAGILKFTLAAKGTATFDGAGHCFGAVTDRYEVFTWSPDFKQRTTYLSLDRKPEYYSQAELDAILARITEQYRAGYPAQYRDFINLDTMTKAFERAEIS